MIKTPFRFLHASDLRLEEPVGEIGENAEAIEDRLLAAPMEAAKRLFQHAVTEAVDFVVLSGNVVDPNASGPGPLVFLIEQFSRLAEAGIPVYWAGSDRDGPEHWPAALYLPENVHFFRAAGVEEIIVSKEGIPIARLLGFSRGNRSRTLSASEFVRDASGLYTIAVANGQMEPESVRFRGISFWALGGLSRRTFRFLPETPADFPLERKRKERVSSHRRSDPPEDRDDERKEPTSIVHYPGPTLARGPKDKRRYGATLVDVDVKGESNLTFLATSPYRWIEEKIEFESGATVKQLRSEIQKRILAYRAIKSRDDVMISWVVDCPGGTLPTDLREGTVTRQLLEELRTDYGIEPPICWSVDIVTTPPDLTMPGLYDQKTILADFLRAIRHFQGHPYEPINVLQFLPGNIPEFPFADRLALSLPPELASRAVLKEVMFGDPGREPSSIEQIQLENTREKIRDVLRQERIRKAILKRNKAKHVTAHEIESPAKNTRPSGGAPGKPRRRPRARILKLMRNRRRLVQELLREAAALGWDMLGSETDKKALGIGSGPERRGTKSTQ